MKDNNKLQKIDYDKLSQFQLVEKIKEMSNEIQKLKKRKKYGLVWDEEKTKEVFEQEVQKKLPVLKEVTKNEIKDTDKSKSNNILIEGDNYHALSVLNYTHKGKIDMIYIDPPYNTGKEFTYNDKIVDKEDSYKHSKWLSFIKKRLELAKKLLSNKGMIFISINDNEQAQLKILCDEVFESKNFIANLIWKRKSNPPNNVSIGTVHEYILIYSKDYEHVSFNLQKRTDYLDSQYTNPDNDPRGIWKSGDLSAAAKGGRLTNSLIYEIINPHTGEKHHPPKGRMWIVVKSQMAKHVTENRIWWGTNKNGKPKYKRFLSEVRQGVSTSSIIEEGTNSIAARELSEIFNGKLFYETPKPTVLLKKIIQISTNKNSTILDFFAGSGTTGHATLQLNKEDSGNRKFILCTNNENNICTNVCYPRLKKIIKGYKNPKGEKVKGLGGNLKYFKTAFVDSKPNNKNKRIIISQSTEMLCLKEDCFNQVTLGKLFKIFKNPDGRYLGIVYDQGGIKPFKKAVLKLNKKINVYVFSLIDTVNDDTFEEISSLVTLKPTPSAILNTYKKICTCVETTKLIRKKHPNGLKQIRCESGVSEV